MATERNFITPSDVVVLTTANVVGNTTSTDYFANTARSNTTPSLVLDFARTKTVDSRITFRRASPATYTDAKGTIVTVANNVPRIDYANGVCRGLLIEEGRTNWFANERILAQGYLKTGTSIGPDGKTAYRWMFPSNTLVGFPNVGRSSQSYGFTLAQGSSIDFTFTGYIGPSIGDPQVMPLIVIEVNTNDSTNSVYGTLQFNGSLGTTGSFGGSAQFTFPYSYTVVQHPNGMWKVTFTARYTQDATIRNKMVCYFQPRDLGGNGNFMTGNQEVGFEYSCCQVEVGSRPTSYIPTYGDYYARASDIAVITSPFFDSWYNQSGGALYVEYQQVANSLYKGIAAITTGDPSGNNVSFQLYNNNNTMLAEVFVNGSAVTQYGTPYTPGSLTKVVQTANSSYNVIGLNGVISGGPSNASNGLPQVTGMTIGGSRFQTFYGGSVDPANMALKKLVFYKQVLSNNEIIALTT